MVDKAPLRVLFYYPFALFTKIETAHTATPFKFLLTATNYYINFLINKGGILWLQK